MTKGSLRNDEGNGNENVTRKYIFIYFVLIRDYFNSLNFYKNGKPSRNQIGRSGVQVKRENEKFTAVRSRSPQSLKCGLPSPRPSRSIRFGYVPEANGRGKPRQKQTAHAFVLFFKMAHFTGLYKMLQTAD